MPKNDETRSALRGMLERLWPASGPEAFAGPDSTPVRGKDFGTLPILGASDLEVGDVLHLRVNSVFTAHHGVRPMIRTIQFCMLTSASRSRRSLYYDVLREHRERGLPFDDPVPGHDSLQDTVEDLTDSGHTTIYVGDGRVIETTGAGCRVRRWRDVDTARYVVMRARAPEHRALIARFAWAVGGSVVAEEVQARLASLRDELPPLDQSYLDGLCRAECRREVADLYDAASASRGFFTKLTARYHIASPTALDTMLYLGEDEPPTLHRDTVCSSFAALVMTLCDRAMGWRAIGQTFDETEMTSAQRDALEDLRAGIGCSTHVRPEFVLPSYLALGMKVSGRFETLGQFINLGSCTNPDRSPEEAVALVHPHLDYVDATAHFLEGLTAAQRRQIELPALGPHETFAVTDEAGVRPTRGLETVQRIYEQLYRERTSA